MRQTFEKARLCLFQPYAASMTVLESYFVCQSSLPNVETVERELRRGSKSRVTVSSQKVRLLWKISIFREGVLNRDGYSRIGDLTIF